MSRLPDIKQKNPYWLHISFLFEKNSEISQLVWRTSIVVFALLIILVLAPQKDVCCSSLSSSSSKWYHASWCRLKAWKRETHILSTFQLDKIMMHWYDAKWIYLSFIIRHIQMRYINISIPYKPFYIKPLVFLILFCTLI